MTFAKINDTDAKKFRNRDGQTNIVGRVRATRKGAKAYGGPSEGEDGNRFHPIRKGSDSVLYCDCPAWRFGKADEHGIKRPCKHVRAFLVHLASVINGTAPAISTDVIIYSNPSA